MTDYEVARAAVDRLEALSHERLGVYEGEFSGVSFSLLEEGSVVSIRANEMTVWVSEFAARPEPDWTPESLADHVLSELDALAVNILKLSVPPGTLAGDSRPVTATRALLDE